MHQDKHFQTSPYNSIHYNIIYSNAFPSPCLYISSEYYSHSANLVKQARRIAKQKTTRQIFTKSEDKYNRESQPNAVAKVVKD